MRYLFIALVAIVFASCGTQRQIKKCQKCYELLPTTKTEIKDSTHISYDTVPYYLTVPKDSIIGKYEIVCDSSGKASIKSSTVTKGNRSDLSTTLENNTLTIQATCNELIDSIQTLNKTIKKYRSENNTVSVPRLVEKELTWMQKFILKVGGWSFVIVVLYIFYRIAKKYYKVNTPMGLILTLRRKLMR